MVNIRMVTKKCVVWPSRLKFICCVVPGFLISGCSLAPTETFTLQTDMPASFRLHADAKYVPATGESCTLRPRAKNITPFKSERQEVAHTVVFKIPLTETIDGCPLVLKSLKLDIQGKYGPDRSDIGGDNAWLSFQDGSSTGAANSSEPSSKIFNGQCQWYFRTMGPKRYIAKILQCRAEDENGQVLPRLAGGYLQRDQLAGQTINISFRLSEEERPYMGDTWIKFQNGWKRCMGKGLDDHYGFCRGNDKSFKPFKMPDGRDCTIYPSCTE